MYKVWLKSGEFCFQGSLENDHVLIDGWMDGWMDG